MIDIDREHPDFKRQKLTWRSLPRSVRGRATIQTPGGRVSAATAKGATRRLQRAPAEGVLSELHRLDHRLVFRDAVPAGTGLHFQGENEAGQRFLSELADDCDLRGTNLTSFFQAVLQRCADSRPQPYSDRLSAGCTHVRQIGPKRMRVGLSRAYLVRYSAEDLINWSFDERGDFEWVVLKQSAERQPSCGLVRNRARDLLVLLRRSGVPNVSADRTR